MGTRTTASNVFLPELVEQSVEGAFSGISVMQGIGAAIYRDGLLSSTEGEIVNVPYFDSLGELDDITTDGDGLSLTTFGQTAEQATVNHSGKMFEMTRLARAGANDPYAEASKQMAEAARRRFDRALIECASSTPLVQTYTTSDFLQPDMLTDAQSLFADEENDIAGLVVHSKVKASLRKVKDADGNSILVDAKEGGLARINGIPIITTDRAPVQGSMGAVTSAGTSPPTITLTGTPAGAYELRVSVTTAGALGTSKIKYSLDGGVTYTENVTTAATVLMVDPFTKQSSGVTLNIASGSASVDNTYTASFAGTFSSLLLRKGSMVLWRSDAFADEDKDISRDTKVAAVHVYWIAHLYKRMPGLTRPGVVRMVHGIVS